MPLLIFIIQIGSVVALVTMGIIDYNKRRRAEKKLNAIQKHIKEHTWIHSSPSFENNPPSSTKTTRVVEVGPISDILGRS